MVKHKYVVEHKKGGYQVMINLDGKHHYIGLYKTVEQAILERDNAIKRLGIIPKYNNMYFDNKMAFYQMVVSKAQGKLTPKLLQMCMKIVKGVSRKFRYKNEDDRWDCESYAIEMIVKNWYLFDTDKYDNIMAWVTEVVKRGFALQFKRLQKTRLNTISYDSTNDDGKGIKNYI